MTRWWWFRACNSSGRDNGEVLSSAHANGKSYCAANRNASPDGQTSLSQSNVLAAAQTLAMILQQSGNMAPSPDPITAGIINTWLETHLPEKI
ncbi:hypothetical protein Bhyg_03287 [Pseudolycoriella hygida]|uniref:Uncharacterized protein n=1 Tax=Pseudolycoriella hygida TaxID=35572 RepID=A0A9Q0ND13_9DIPT|nr:hypothetical protein Bhyg_03287 [Pseudolycoriella hygida]